ENKIDAALQPNQGLRYSQRAKRWAGEANVSQVVTALLAPASYPSRIDGQNFDIRIEYEEVADVLTANNDGRSTFLRETIIAGVEAARQGYVMNPNTNVTDMWQACWKIALTVAP